MRITFCWVFFKGVLANAQITFTIMLCQLLTQYLDLHQLGTDMG